MENFKEFQGKSLDDAIRGACAYFDAPREKLEIDIVQDAKNGIFGLVGARKAVIKARRAQLKTSVGPLLGRHTEGRTRGGAAEPAPERAESARSPEKPAGRTPERSPAKSPEKSPEKSAEKPGEKSCVRASVKPEGAKPGLPNPSRAVEPVAAAAALEPAKEKSAPSGPPPEEEPCGPSDPPGRYVSPDSPGSHEPEDSLDQEDVGDEYAAVSFSELDREKLIVEGRKAAENLITPILGPVEVSVSLGEGRLDVHVECGEDSGLLIGREGQTLAALQYLASRIVSRAMDAPVRLQFDVGDYRERQDERLRELALSLAERVRAGGRSCSTRPLSSYHRRIIHLTLQNEPDVQTRSSGEGPLKRVIVLRRRSGADRKSSC